MTIALEVRQVVLLRLNLHPSGEGTGLHRGDVGEVCEVRDSDGTVKVRFRATDVCVRCVPEWLERSPGTICLGINTMLNRYVWDPFYDQGMMVSDICFPTEEAACFSRMQCNLSRLMESGLGFSIYDEVDATNARWLLRNKYAWSQDKIDERIGLVLCEEIWPWDRGQWPDIACFHNYIAQALMSQWGNATCVMVLRSDNAKQMQRASKTIKRISYHYGSAFNLHYTPLCMDGAHPPRPVIGQTWCAVVIHPSIFDRRLVASDGDVYIPELVLKTMFSQKCTLQLCAYTGESALGIMDYLNNSKKLHGVKP